MRLRMPPIAHFMRTRLLAGFAIQVAGVCTAVLYSNPVIALALVYVGLIIQHFHKLRIPFKTEADHAPKDGATHYIVQCKGENGWFDHVLQQYPRKTVSQYPAYNLAKNQLDTILKTRGATESNRLRIVKRTTREDIL